MLLRRAILLQLALVIVASSAPVYEEPEIICADKAKTDCYPKDFQPTNEYKLIRDGQQIPKGLDIQIDWQSGDKFAKIGEKGAQKVSNQLVEVVEEDKNKIVSYSEDMDEEDAEIIAMKKAYGSHSTLDFKDSLASLLQAKDETDLAISLDSLTEHSHNLKDGALITEPVYFQKLLDILVNASASIKELSLRVIAQSLRHNTKAVSNIDLDTTLPKFLSLLTKEKNPVLQKRILGVISGLIQTEEGSLSFIKSGGEKVLLDQFEFFKEDSKIRALEILEDLKANHLSKRGVQDNSKLFQELQNAFKNDEFQNDHSIDYAFDRLIDLKKSSEDLKTDPKFLDWLVNITHRKKLVKRSSDGKVHDDSLHRKLLEARHLVFGNPNALRKALADEL